MRYISNRTERMGSAIFAELAGWKREAEARGMRVIDLGIGSPDGPPPKVVIEALESAIRDTRQYGYPSSEGSAAFRETVADWYMYRFGVSLDPHAEAVALMGSQDGLAHLPMAIADPGDTALLPDPGYPIYSAGAQMAGLQQVYYPLREENAFLPRLDAIDAETARKARYMLVNYPNNPLAAVADLAFFEELVAFARKHDIIIVHDLAYSEMAFDGFRPPSVLQIPGAKSCCVEFHSLSKSFNMAGCRIGFLVGQPDVVGALRALKANIDYGTFSPVQQAGIAALRHDMTTTETIGPLYENRRNALVQGLRKIGWNVPSPKATMFIWAPVPKGFTSRQISREMLHNAGVVVIPGDAFGSEGEGYVRMALVHNEAELQEASRRIGDWLKHTL